MSYNSKNYTRCEKCKYIDRENEQCKITNDNWLVSDKAGTCHQFEGVESMKVKPINNIRGARLLEASCDKEYDVVREEGDKFVIINEQKEEKAYYKSWFEVIEDESKVKKLEENISRIDLVIKAKDFFDESWKLDIIENRCPSEFKLNEYNEVQCVGDDSYGCCTRCWNEPATKVEIERLLHRDKIEKLEENLHEKSIREFDKQMERVGDLASKCSVSEEELFNNPIKPSHYQAGEFDVIAFCFKYDLDFASGNVIKYIVRTGKKDKNKELEDLLKAKEYLERKIEWVKAND